MQNISVESAKSYFFGFVIKEQDLRRLIDQVTEQYLKLGSGNLKSTYQLKLANGAIASTQNINEVLNHDNEGSTEIERLEIEMSYTLQTTEEYVIKIIFRNVDSKGENGFSSIKYNIIGFSKDWVFVTSSLLDERISKLKRFSFNQLAPSSSSSFLIRLAFPLIIMIILFIITLSLSIGLTNGKDKKIILIENSLRNWKEQKVKDPTELYLNLELEKAKFESEKNIQSLPLLNLIKNNLIIWMFGILLSFFCLYIFVSKYYPMYNFCWGEYIQKFNRKESIRKTVFIIVILGLIVSIVGGLITNYISK